MSRIVVGGLVVAAALAANAVQKGEQVLGSDGLKGCAVSAFGAKLLEGATYVEDAYLKTNVRPWNCRGFVFDETTAASWPEIRDTAGAGVCGPKPKVWIKDAIANADRYAKLNPHFAKAFAFMRRGDLKTMPCRRYELVPGKCWAVVSESTNIIDLAARGVEVHRDFIDIQLPVSGPETIGVAEALDTDLASMRGFDIEKDIGFLMAPVEPLVLRPGEFAVLFPPRCLHAPGCRAEGTVLPHRKVVIKVAAECGVEE